MDSDEDAGVEEGPGMYEDPLANTERPINAVLGEITNMLGTVIKRLEKTESKLESMERRLVNNSSGSSSKQATKKRCVPKVVRVSISTTV